MDSPLWTPSPDRIAGTRMTAFMQAVQARYDVAVGDYTSLYAFSVARPLDFWTLMWEFADVRGTKGQRVADHLDRMPGATFFPDATLNFSSNLLRDSGDDLAVIFKGEDRPARSMTRGELYRDWQHGHDPAHIAYHEDMQRTAPERRPPRLDPF